METGCYDEGVLGARDIWRNSVAVHVGVLVDYLFDGQIILKFTRMSNYS